MHVLAASQQKSHCLLLNVLGISTLIAGSQFTDSQ